MKLAAGKVKNSVSIKTFTAGGVLYTAEEKMYINLIKLNNTANFSVSISLIIVYGEQEVSLTKENKVLSSGEELVISTKYYLDEFESIRCSTSYDDAVTFHINGDVIANEVNDLTVSVSTVNDITAGSVAGIISSPQILRLIPSLPEDDAENDIYIDYAAVQNVARGKAEVNLKYINKIDEPGDVTVTDGGISGNNDFNDYVNILGINRDVNLLLPNKTIENTPGTLTIENVTVKFLNSGAGNPILIGQKFKDVYFLLDCDTFEFQDVTFEGICYIKIIAGTVIFGNSIGGLLVTNADPGDNVFGYFGRDITKF